MDNNISPETVAAFEMLKKAVVAAFEMLKKAVVAAFEMLKKAVNSMIHSLASLSVSLKKRKRKEMYTRRYLRHGKVYTPRRGKRVA